jgi:hypothetical protein
MTEPDEHQRENTDTGEIRRRIIICAVFQKGHGRGSSMN